MEASRTRRSGSLVQVSAAGTAALRFDAATAAT